jgi:cytochrome bd-type quinol oxidase subunit 1
MHGERSDENPYAPPRAEISPTVVEKEPDDVGKQRTKHLRRESSIRVAGLRGLILAGFVVLTFGLGALSELYRQEEEGIEPWMYRRWVARMICVTSIAVLAFVTSWGLFRLRNWGRWALTIVTTLPVPALVCGWLVLSFTPPGLQ